MILKNDVSRFIVRKFPTRTQMGQWAAGEVIDALTALWRTRECVNMIFAAAPSQSDFLEAFRGDSRVDFNRIRAFHMDEYLGLPADAPQGFGNFLRRYLFDHGNFREVHFLNGLTDDPGAECLCYGELLRRYPPDIVCLGVGENGHIAFNDPHEADFDDPAAVKVVTLDERCRTQQVNDGCFEKLDDVPHQAITLTIPTLAHAPIHCCVVPAPTKAEAVRNMVLGPVTVDCPASILRTCAHAMLYIDADSGKYL